MWSAASDPLSGCSHSPKGQTQVGRKAGDTFQSRVLIKDSDSLMEKKSFMFSETWLQRVFCYFYSWENIFRNVVFITLPEEALICRCCILSPAPAFPLPDALILLFHTHRHASEPSVAGVRVCVCPSAGLACLADSSNLFQDGAHIPTNTLWQPCQHNSAHSFCNKRCQTGFS